jgi:acyl-CoA thioesterase FadM
MEGGVETYRGTVYRWEVDNVDHFTVAYYFQRFEDATTAMLRTLGLDGGPGGTRGRGWRPAAGRVRYLKELRVGDLLHMRSGVIGIDGGVIRLGHRVFNSGTGDLCTTVELEIALVDEDGRPALLEEVSRPAVEAHRIEWEPRDGTADGPAAWDASGVGDGFVDSARDTVKPWELNAAGRAGWPAYIHRFSAANAHALAAFGMTPAYMRQARRAFSTFEFRLHFGAPLSAGDLVSVQSAVRHVGTSSLRVLHRMSSGPGAGIAATLEQSGVHFDLDTRRPCALPAALRERALAMLTAAARGRVGA